ncbi:terminase [Puerhibacterium puerhi]|uniref:terminase n=1 Tax=Puerhibacterium puerhi TaxID=2692623 RepID=UPI0013588653|nr:terminase [Puerhibacterium puerhi]
MEKLDLDAEVLEPTYIGPTWQRNPDGSWKLPEKTLGWQIIGWCATRIRDLDDESKFWKFTPEQMRFLLWFYAVDANGRFIYRKACMQRLKGAGKDPLLAVICLIEFCGPSRFSHWDKDGNPVGKRHPRAWVQVAAVSRDQTKTTFSLFPSLISDALKAEFSLEIGREQIRGLNGSINLVAVTSNPRSLEGFRSTFVVANEVWHWVSGNQGIAMYEAIERNVKKVGGRYVALTNAYVPGEDSAAERIRNSYEQVQEGRAADVGLMYDSIEAHPQAPLDPVLLPRIIEGVRGDAYWLNPQDVVESILDITFSPALSRRVWLNQIIADEDSIYSIDEWRRLSKGFEDEQLRPGDEITLGFDGGKTDDATALVGYRLSDGFVQILGLWEKPIGWDSLQGAEGKKWQVPQEEVDSRVHEAFALYKVRGFYADVSLWESYITEWTKAYAEGLVVKATGNSPIGWDMRSKKASTYAHEALMNAVLDQRIHHNNDLTLQRHVMNARRRTNDWGVSFSKESPDSPKKVDAYAALMLAHKAASDIAARGKEAKRERTGRMWAF